MMPRSAISQLRRLDPARPAPANSELSRSERALLGQILATPRPAPGGARLRDPIRAFRRRRAIIAGVAVVTVVAVASGLGLGLGRGSPPEPTNPAVVAFLTGAARAAASHGPIPALGPGQDYYERNIESNLDLCQLRTTPSGTRELVAGAGLGLGPTFNYLSDIAFESWSGPPGAAFRESAIGAGHFYTDAQARAWREDGSPSVDRCAVPAPGLQRVDEPGGGGVAELPRDPAALGSLIAAGRVEDSGRLRVADGHCPSRAGDAAQVFPHGAVCSVSAQFDIASNLLGAPEGPELVGAALYKILAQLPGVEDLGDRTDVLGRSGEGIEDPSTGTVFIIDPATGTLLGREALTMESGLSNKLGPDVAPGAIVSSIAYGPLEVVHGLGLAPSRTS